MNIKYHEKIMKKPLDIIGREINEGDIVVTSTSSWGRSTMRRCIVVSTASVKESRQVCKLDENGNAITETYTQYNSFESVHGVVLKRNVMQKIEIDVYKVTLKSLCKGYRPVSRGKFIIGSPYPKNYDQNAPQNIMDIIKIADKGDESKAFSTKEITYLKYKKLIK